MQTTSDKSLTLYVPKCAAILAGFENTTVLICSNATIAGVHHPPIKGLTKYHNFRFLDSKTACVAMYSDDRESVSVAFESGRMMPADEAKVSAKSRKLKTAKIK